MAQSQQPYGRRTDTERKMAGDPMRDVIGSEDTASNVVRQAGLAGEGLQEVAENFKTAIDRSIRDQPMATLAIAAMAGFVIGAIWKA